MEKSLESLISLALQEDMPAGDITTDSLHCENKIGVAKLIAKSRQVLSGMEIFETVYKKVDPHVQVTWHKVEGDSVEKSTEIATIKGPLASLLKAERTALNFMGHLCGIATLTADFVKETKGTKCKITDTRKTTPSLRSLEKRAVIHGGGVNHRMNLSDAVLIKENHIRVAGSITQAVKLCRENNPGKSIEVEVTSENEIREALTSKVNRIMLDNMSLEQMVAAVKIINGAAVIEASGNMTLERIKAVAQTGVDFISVGAITHSAPCSDLSVLHE